MPLTRVMVFTYQHWSATTRYEPGQKVWFEGGLAIVVSDGIGIHPVRYEPTKETTMERRVFTYKDVEEARKYIGKSGKFSDDFRAVSEGSGEVGVLDDVSGFAPFRYTAPSHVVYRQFFSPDPEPVEKWVPFTAEDHELFKGRWVTSKGWDQRLASMIVSLHLNGVHFVAPATGGVSNASYTDLLNRYTFTDGTPCGKKVVE